MEFATRHSRPPVRPQIHPCILRLHHLCSQRFRRMFQCLSPSIAELRGHGQKPPTRVSISPCSTATCKMEACTSRSGGVSAALPHIRACSTSGSPTPPLQTTRSCCWACGRMRATFLEWISGCIQTYPVQLQEPTSGPIAITTISQTQLAPSEIAGPMDLTVSNGIMPT